MDKVEYWLGLCDDNMVSARLLLNGKQYLDTGFFCHQIAEKALKAVVANVTTEVPPRIHDLSKLAERGGIYDDLSEAQLDYLEELNPLNIEARYPDYKTNIAKTMTAQRITKIFKETEGFLCWIKEKLGR
ncbi:MAG: HEPN domain-containing protein [Oscillospiraceae bacterium]|nr:HEPN domain-containing protein [Oscillospiraceae bacterium]